MMHRILLFIAALLLGTTLYVALVQGLPAAREVARASEELEARLATLSEFLRRAEALPVRQAHLDLLREATEELDGRGAAYLQMLYSHETPASTWLRRGEGPYAALGGGAAELYFEFGNDVTLAALAAGISENLDDLALLSRDVFERLSPAGQELALLELLLLRRAVTAFTAAAVSDVRRLRFDRKARPGPYGEALRLVGFDLVFAATPAKILAVLHKLTGSGLELPVFDIEAIGLRRMEAEDWGLNTTRYEEPPAEAAVRLRVLVPAHLAPS
ncbi:MAG: hypothetical protein AB1486_00025 [Planctomycetota bacterium]